MSHGFPTRVSFEEASGFLLAAAREHLLPPEPVSLVRAAGRVLAEDLHAGLPLPNFDNAAMDGFALGPAGDDPLRWSLVGDQFAGQASLPPLAPGECARITTGALLPAGAVAVAMREEASVCADRVVLSRPVAIGEHLRRRGEDVAPGECVLRAGTRLDAAHVGLAAALGFAVLPCRRRPAVAVFSSGDELVPPGQALGAGQIHDSNRYQLMALLGGEGLEPMAWPSLPDDPGRIRAALDDASGAFDVVITCGGVSAGEKDFLPALLREHGEVVFWKVRLKPGMPVLFGRWGKALLLSLPGNPVSVLATWHAFARPLLMALQGDAAGPPRWRARTRNAISKSHARLELMRARWTIGEEGGVEVDVDPVTGSNRLRRAAEANGLVRLAEGPAELPAGSIVELWPI